MIPAEWGDWAPAQARDWIAVPGAHDDKYSRGVLGLLTGSADYPGAAVLGVEAALHSGVGMVRYLGPQRAADFVLARRPETVTAIGRVQAWLLGSGMDAAARDAPTSASLASALAEGLPTVIDAGALDLIGAATGPVVITPHARELAGVLGRVGITVSAEQIAEAPGEWAVRAAESLAVTVLLKGSVTHVASPLGVRLTVARATPWLATAGTGDVLGGVLGALVATHSDRIRADAGALASLAATASLIHGLAAHRVSAGGPFTALDLAGTVSQVVRDLATGNPEL
nr:ADP/ATP-dependent (S)-NAD(P)H-hydrate dehydratase [Leifsonia psychrotolerans]